MSRLVTLNCTPIVFHLVRLSFRSYFAASAFSFFQRVQNLEKDLSLRYTILFQKRDAFAPNLYNRVTIDMTNGPDDEAAVLLDKNHSDDNEHDDEIVAGGDEH